METALRKVVKQKQWHIPDANWTQWTENSEHRLLVSNRWREKRLKPGDASQAKVTMNSNWLFFLLTHDTEHQSDHEVSKS